MALSRDLRECVVVAAKAEGMSRLAAAKRSGSATARPSSGGGSMRRVAL